jgi:NitT/TauT family transport system ATP-binding protein
LDLNDLDVPYHHRPRNDANNRRKPAKGGGVAVHPESEPYIRLRNASLSYGTAEGVLALTDVTMDIAKGEFVAIVGPSGCGKSSLLKLVSGLHPALKGETYVAGKKVSGPLKICGMAFQNPTLLPWRTALNNVLLPLEIVQPHASRFRSHRDEYLGQAKELLNSVGLTGFEDRYPWQLSGGMQQRNSLCRALIHEPELLLLDEPFGALDPFTREELWDVLQALCVKRRPTVVLVTHDLREAVYLADTVYVFSQRPGRVLSRTSIKQNRPRRLDDTYSTEFTDMVHALRAQIATGRQ